MLKFIMGIYLCFLLACGIEYFRALSEGKKGRAWKVFMWLLTAAACAAILANKGILQL